MEKELQWTQVDERHLRAESEFGPFWIRHDREGQVNGLYWRDPETVKRVPACKDEREIAGAKLVCSLALADMRYRAQLTKS